MNLESTAHRVLVVDVDEHEASLVEGYLRDGLLQPGLEVRHSRSADEARVALAAWPVDVLVVDLRLGDEEVPAFLDSLRERGLDVPAVVLTGRANAEAALAALRAGASDVLAKPNLTPASLAAAIRFAVQLQASKRKEEETKEALHRAERQAEALVVSSLDIVSILDGKGRLLFTSPSTERLLGHPVEAILGRRLQGLVRPEDLPAVEAAFERCLANPGTTVSVEFGVRHADGSARQLESLVRNLLADPGVSGLVVNTRDVTERHRSEDALRRLETAVEQSASIVFMTDVSGAITYVNPAFTRAYGYTREESLGANPRILKSDRHDATFYRNFWETLSAGHTLRSEVVNRAKDGRLVIARALVTPVRDRRGTVTGYLAVQDDVTERSLMAERLRLAQKMEALGHLAREVAHELDSVLSGVLAGLDAAAARLPEGSPATPLLAGAREAARRGAGLSHELLSFGRGAAVEPETVSPNALQRDAAARVREMLGPGVSLRLELSPDPPSVRVDRGEVTEALVRLASFSLESLPPGGTLTLGTGVETTANGAPEATLAPPAGRWVLLTIRDDGPPMEEESRRRLFEPFGSSRALGRGRGLGLAAPFGTVRQAGGFLVGRALERGNVFEVYLPETAA